LPQVEKQDRKNHYLNAGQDHVPILIADLRDNQEIRNENNESKGADVVRVTLTGSIVPEEVKCNENKAGDLHYI